MALAKIQVTLPGVVSIPGQVMYLWEHPGNQNDASDAGPLTLVVDSQDNTTYWTEVDATTLGGKRYRVRINNGSSNQGCGYLWLTNTTNVHVVVDQPWVADADGDTTTPAIITPPNSAEQMHGVGNVFDEYGYPEDGIYVYCQMVIGPAVSGVYDSDVARFTSVDGVVVLENLFKGATYKYWRGQGKQKIQFRVPETEDTQFDLPPLLGSDSTDACLT